MCGIDVDSKIGGMSDCGGIGYITGSWRRRDGEPEKARCRRGEDKGDKGDGDKLPYRVTNGGCEASCKFRPTCLN